MHSPSTPELSVGEGVPPEKIVVRELRKEFRTRNDTFVAIDHISLEIDQGAFFMIVGPSGCGKTTLLRILAGLDPPTSGEVRIVHEDPSKPDDPEILLMDERFSALDEQNRTLLQEELLRIWDETKKTVVFITHSVDEAVTLGDRIMVMTAQPGREKALIDVPFERPRHVLEL